MIFAIISFLLMIGDKDQFNKKLFLVTFVISMLPILFGRW